MQRYGNWHEDSVCVINDEYHITGSGVLSKRDYSILFENDDNKKHIPVEALEQINLYDEVSISSGFVQLMCDKGIRVSIMDRYGMPCGSFDPIKSGTSTKLLLAQSKLFLDETRRLEVAKSMERAAIGNILSCLRSYSNNVLLPEKEINIIENSIQAVNDADSLEKLMLTEARAREAYYHLFNSIIRKKGFEFTVRSRRPPLDPINALISFGNTLLYNEFARIVGKSMLDDRIGVIHISQKRINSLSLDFSDIFKPMIVDRVIFSLINNSRISAQNSFSYVDNNGIYMTKECKETFINAFNDKMNTKLSIRGEKKSYRHYMEDEASSFRKYLEDDGDYHPFIYY